MRDVTETECSDSESRCEAERCAAKDHSRRPGSIGDHPDGGSRQHLRDQQRGDQRATDLRTVDPSSASRTRASRAPSSATRTSAAPAV